MALIPHRFRSNDGAPAIFPALDRLMPTSVDDVPDPLSGSPFRVGGAEYIAYCCAWAPPFEIEDDELED